MRRAKPIEKKKTHPKPPITPLPWQEWDFRDQRFAQFNPNTIIRSACLSYEILRFLYLDPTFECCRREVDLWRTSRKSSPNTDFSAISIHDEFPQTPWFYFTEWPETPFLKLSHERQLAALELMESHTKAQTLRTASNVTKSKKTQDPEIIELWLRSGIIGSEAPMQTPIRQCDPELYSSANWIGNRHEINGLHFTIAAFLFDWSRNNSDILREMEAWLISARKRFCDVMPPDSHLKSDLEYGLETRGNDPTGSVLTDLNALGAYRLSQHHKSYAAAIEWLTAHFKSTHSIDAGDWSRTVSRARYLIYEESLNWISFETDSYWSDGKTYRFKDFALYLCSSTIQAIKSSASDDTADDGDGF